MATDIQRQRHIELEGTTNLRNLGGYRTRDGTKTTRWGVLYRCGQLADVPPHLAQSVLVDQLHIHNAYDLRAHKEVVAKNYNFTNISRHSIGIEPTCVGDFVKRGEDMSSGKTLFHMMEEVYRQMVTEYGAAFGSVVKGIIKSKVSPDNAALFHCTAGKDRTGWASYLILTLLDVTEEDKRLDYLLTNNYFGPSKSNTHDGGPLGMGDDATKTTGSVCDQFLDAGIDEVSKLGGVHAYAKSHMGLTDDDIQQLRDLLLE
jgi:protein-tyrosine phosphatase